MAIHELKQCLGRADYRQDVFNQLGKAKARFCLSLHNIARIAPEGVHARIRMHGMKSITYAIDLIRGSCRSVVGGIAILFIYSDK